MSLDNRLKQEILEVLSELRKVSGKLEDLLTQLDGSSGLSLRGDDGPRIGLFSLLSIPDHLRKSLIILSGCDEATARDVAKETGRTRELESINLNQLHRMGYIKKIRKGREVYFGLKEAES
ncbi:transcriptional regulator [Candidatus Bathyarchaeota archaeon]|nr:transcriptional regulator [Candidatus Bathyarchaeota archaeon]